MMLSNLRAALGAWQVRCLLSLPLTVLLYVRLGVVLRQMERLAARFQAGRLWRLAPRVAASQTVAVEARTREARIWPYRFAWLVRAVGWQSAVHGSLLRHVLEKPEMVALLIASPQAARILRPICRMLAVDAQVLRPLAPGEVAVVVVKVRAKRVRRPREVIVHLRPLQPYVLAAARAWRTKMDK